MRTAEFVSPRHPDKMCDQISDAILDWCLARDPYARVAAEVMGGHGKVYIVGEVTIGESEEESQWASFPEAVREMVARITGDPTLKIEINLVRQSREIAGGVDTGGAGDQGIMRGYAVNETPELMPLEYVLARNLCSYLFSKHPFDGKTQISIQGREIRTIVASFRNVPTAELRQDVVAWLDTIAEAAPGVVIHANPAGDWDLGGFDADTGLTGRKLAVDNYGPRFPIGGGAFSGKDATKVDRSAAYMARRIAVDMLRSEQAESVAVELAYAIGVAEPVSVMAEVTKNGEMHYMDVTSKYSLTPRAIIEFLDLRKPQFEETARRGHFGNGFAWEV